MCSSTGTSNLDIERASTGRVTLDSGKLIFVSPDENCTIELRVDDRMNGLIEDEQPVPSISHEAKCLEPSDVAANRVAARYTSAFTSSGGKTTVVCKDGDLEIGRYTYPTKRRYLIFEDNRDYCIPLGALQTNLVSMSFALRSHGILKQRAILRAKGSQDAETPYSTVSDGRTSIYKSGAVVIDNGDCKIQLVDHHEDQIGQRIADLVKGRVEEKINDLSVCITFAKKEDRNDAQKYVQPKYESEILAYKGNGGNRNFIICSDKSDHYPFATYEVGELDGTTPLNSRDKICDTLHSLWNEVHPR